ncbi:superoxide dismutase [Ni] [Thermodesulfobacteriota bacterium]
MKKIAIPLILGLFVILGIVSQASAHCEIPCGIYGDQARIHMIEENITTIEKSMKSIKALQAEKPTNHNQIVRWVMNKEKHADAIQETVTQYFMTQRIKPDTKDYDKKLGLLHKMLISAMKCKQTTDTAHVNNLRSLLNQFQKIYFDSGK